MIKYKLNEIKKTILITVFANLPVQYCRDLYLVKFREMLFLCVTCVLFLVSKSSICHLSACLLTFHSHIEMVYGGPLNIAA